MKNLLSVLFVFLSISQCYAWKPIFAGHRGGYTGVQNTIEAYRNGIDKYGYSGLECDVRVTKDGEYVIMHDETTNSLGGNLTVATSTLAELQAENFTETRGGIKYIGKICTIKEYLEICKEKNAFPLIELKYTTGINSNSMTNFPGLMKLIDNAGLRDKVIFLTSMKPSLEYIRTNYPDVKCQFLTNANWESHFEWCLKWKITPSIQSGTFDQNTVIRFHQKGLNVAAWTVNDAANYKKYGEWGVYMMTCDYLYAGAMAELEDIDWDKIPEVLDPLEVTTKVLWSRSENEKNLPLNFPSKLSATYKTGQQAAIVDGKFYVNNYDTGDIIVFDKDSNEGEVLAATLPFGGSSAMGITADDAGNIVQRCESSITTTPSLIRIFKKDDKSCITINFSLIDTGQTNFISASGDIFSEEGGYVYLFPNGQKTVSILNISNGVLNKITTAPNLSIAATTAGFVIPINNNPEKFIYQKRDVGYYIFDKENKGNYYNESSATTAPKRNNSVGGTFFTLNGHDILVHPSGANYCGGITVRDMSAPAKDIAQFPALGTSGYSANASTGTFMKAEKIDDFTYNLFCYTMGIGYAAYEIKATQTSVNGLTAETNKFSVYPNPATTTINISNNENIKFIDIYSISGSKIAHYTFSDNKNEILNIEHLKQGIYFITINNKNTTKFIKQR